MSVTKPRFRKTAAGLAAVLGLAAGGLATAAATSAGRAPSRPAASAAVSRQTDQAARARASLLGYLRESRPLADLAPGLKPGSSNVSAGSRGTAQVGSYNWSGYADASSPGTFTAVSAKWRQPATACSSEQRLASFWVGLDGVNDTTVEQVGTLAYCFEGVPSYYTWWDIYPGASVFVGSTIRPGDLILASVKVSGTNYTLSLVDATTPGNSFSTVQTCSTCQNSSAEWIAERPAFQIGITPLTFFSTWSPTNGSQTSGGTKGSIASGPDATQITMVDATGTYPLDKISGLNRTGTGFSARWLNSY